MRGLCTCVLEDRNRIHVKFTCSPATSIRIRKSYPNDLLRGDTVDLRRDGPGSANCDALSYEAESLLSCDCVDDDEACVDNRVEFAITA